MHVTSSGVADAMARQMVRTCSGLHVSHCLSVAYGSCIGLQVEDSELSRGLAEELAEEHLLELEVKLLQAANDMMKSQLSLVLQKIVGMMHASLCCDLWVSLLLLCGRQVLRKVARGSCNSMLFLQTTSAVQYSLYPGAEPSFSCVLSPISDVV